LEVVHFCLQHCFGKSLKEKENLAKKEGNKKANSHERKKGSGLSLMYSYFTGKIETRIYS